MNDADKREARLAYGREYSRRWRKNNPERFRAQKRLAYARNPEAAKAKVQLWREANPEKVRALQQRRAPSDREWCLKKKYKMTLAQWDALFEAQGRVCAACGSTEPKTKNGWHTDHDHATGRVRGILCLHCNVGIGKARDNIATLQMWIEYLRRQVEFRGDVVRV
jgi:hypothetical protein